MNKLRLGVLSVSGHFALRIQKPLSQSDILQVEGIASRKEEKARKAAEEWGIPRYYGSYQALLDDPDIDAVYIPLPNDMHAHWVKKAADAGKHVLCEKPFAMDAEETRMALEYARSKGVLAEEAFMYRFHPQWVQVKQWLDMGKLGKVKAIHCFFTYDNQDPGNIRNQREKGGGALYDIGCYAISTARLIAGREPRRVVALMQEDQRFKTDVLSSALLDFDGIQSSFTVSTQSYPEQKVQIIGEKGMLTVLQPFNARPELSEKVHLVCSDEELMHELPAVDQYRILFETFAKAISKEEEFPVSPMDPVNNMKVIDALFKSVEQNGWVEIRES